MKIALDNMSINDAIKVYYEKMHAMQQGDITKLISLKNAYPDIFDKNNDAEICEIIEYLKKFQESSCYKELNRQILKEKFTVINNTDF